MAEAVKNLVKSAIKEKAKETIQEKVSDFVTGEVQAHDEAQSQPKQSPSRPVPSGNSCSGSHIGRGINSMNSMRPHSDLLLHIGPSKQPFHVHKAILIKSSRFFENIIVPPPSSATSSATASSSAPTSSHNTTSSFSSDTTVTSTTTRSSRHHHHHHHHHRRVIELTDLDASIFPLILEFFYSDHFPQQAKLLEIAKMYDHSTGGLLDAKRLKSKCVKHFCRVVVEEGFCVKPTPLEEFAVDAADGSTKQDKETKTKDRKDKWKEKEKVGFAKDAEEAVTKYAEDLVELCDACIIIFAAYERKDRKYLWKILSVLREKHLLKEVMRERKVKKALKGSSEASSAILEFYSKKE